MSTYTFLDIEKSDFDDKDAAAEYARPGYTLKGAWEIEPERTSSARAMST